MAGLSHATLGQYPDGPHWPFLGPLEPSVRPSRRVWAACAVLLLGVASVIHGLGPDRTPIPRNMPGEVLGGVQAHWLAL